MKFRINSIEILSRIRIIVLYALSYLWGPVFRSDVCRFSQKKKMENEINLAILDQLLRASEERKKNLIKESIDKLNSRIDKLIDKLDSRIDKPTGIYFIHHFILFSRLFRWLSLHTSTQYWNRE